MVVSRFVHDEMLVHLEEPKQAHLQEELQRVVTQGSNSKAAQAHVKRSPRETTPLVLKAGETTAYIDIDVDLSALDRKLHEEELEALRVDRETPALDITREEAVSLVKMSIPMTTSILLERLALLALNMLLGNVSHDMSAAIIAANSLATVSIAQISFPFVGGIGFAVDTMCAQSFGAKQYTQLWLYVQAGVLAMAYCVPFIVLVTANGTSLLIFLGQDPGLASLASFFMRMSLLRLPLYIPLSVMTSVLVAQGIVVPFTFSSLVSYGISIPLAYFLGYHTSLGYVGFPIATFVNVFIQNVVVARALLQNSLFLDSWPGWQVPQAHAVLRKMWPLGVSSILMVAFQDLGFSIVSILSGLLPHAATAISAGTIGINWIILAFMPLVGFSTSGAVRIGNALGGGRPRRARIASGITLAATLAVSVVSVVFCITFADAFTHAYTTDEATAQAATKLIFVMLPIIPLIACNLTAQATFRACAKQLLSAQLKFLAMTVIGVPLGCLLAFQFAWGAAGLWTGQTLGFIVFNIASGFWVYRQDWTQLAHIARQNAHLHVEKAATEPVPEPREGSEASQHE